MQPFGHWFMPDARLMARLVVLVRHCPTPTVFITGGEALASTIVATRGLQPIPEWAEDLADAMVGALLRVQVQTLGEPEPERLLALATAATVLSTVRPGAARVCHGAATVWLGSGVGAARRLGTADALASLALLALLHDDRERAAEAVDALVDRESGDGVGWVLHDWAVSRLQDHGRTREALCFHNLRLAVARASADHRSTASLLVLGAVVSAERYGRRRDRVVDWLDEVAREVAEAGTSCRTAV